MAVDLYQVKKSLSTLFGLTVLLAVFQGDAQAGMNKCTDENGHVIYSDYPCIKTKRESMDIMVAPVDEVAARRLQKKSANSSSGNSRKNNRSKTVKESSKTKKKSSNCGYYQDRIKSVRESMRNGYTSAQGESYRRSISDYKEQYRKNCK